MKNLQIFDDSIFLNEDKIDVCDVTKEGSGVR
jgi:hypothetical protein